jgi:hypothetical protein
MCVTAERSLLEDADEMKTVGLLTIP